MCVCFLEFTGVLLFSFLKIDVFLIDDIVVIHTWGKSLSYILIISVPRTLSINSTKNLFFGVFKSFTWSVGDYDYKVLYRQEVAVFHFVS